MALFRKSIKPIEDKPIQRKPIEDDLIVGGASGNYQIATARAAESQALIQAQNTKSKKNKWILPVGIGLGVILIGTIIFFVVKKGKKASS